jgi:glucose-6-phosphate dehydrogenase assembly protein OpcA
MSSSYKILGQVDMTSSSLTTLYTCPSDTETVISTIIIANRASVADTFRLAMRDGGEAISDKHYLAYDVPVAANDSTTLTLGVAMQATDVLSIAAGGTASELSFNAFGAEVTI